jgi:hypothetical protein
MKCNARARIWARTRRCLLRTRFEIRFQQTLMTMPRNDLPFCECRWLENAAHDPNCPIEFDPGLNEYNLKTTNGGSMRIYHCPFCSGRAPESLRARMFATVTYDETSRLHHLTATLKTEEEVRAALGEPTHVFDPGGTSGGRENDDKPGEIKVWKTLRYDQHSDTANINVKVNRHGRVSISFSGKYIGKLRADG